MAQKLILPINKLRITAGYKNANYRKEFGYNHYGVDYTDQARDQLINYASQQATKTQTIEKSLVIIIMV